MLQSFKFGGDVVIVAFFESWDIRRRRHLASWAAVAYLYSAKDLWTRMGLLGNQLITSDHSYLDRAMELMIRRDAGTGKGGGAARAAMGTGPGTEGSVSRSRVTWLKVP